MKTDIEKAMDIAQNLAKTDEDIMGLIMTLTTALIKHDETIKLMSKAVAHLIQDRDKLEIRLKALEDRVK